MQPSEITAGLNLFGQFDSNKDFILDRKEAAELRLFDTIDSNKDGFLNLPEWFRYSGKDALANTTQSILANGIYRYTQLIFERNRLSEPYDRMGILISLGTYLGGDYSTDPLKVSQFLTSTIRQDYTIDALRALPSILDAGISTPRVIQSMIDKIVSGCAGESESAFRELPPAIEAILKVGIIDPHEIRAILEKVVSASGTGSYMALGSLPAMIAALRTTGINNPTDIRLLIDKTASAAGYLLWQAFVALPVAARGLVKTGMTTSETVRIIERTVAVCGVGSFEALGELPVIMASMAKTGITDSIAIRSLIGKIGAASGASSARALTILPSILGKGITNPERIRLLFKAIVTAAGQHSMVALASIPSVLNSSKVTYEGEGNQRRLIDGLKFLVRYSRYSPYKKIFPILKFDIADIDYNNFPIIFTMKLRRYISDNQGALDRTLFTMLSSWINAIHDSDMTINRSDFIRQEVSDNLDFRSAYMLIAMGGADLYTSSFTKIWNSQVQRTTDLLASIEKADPNNLYLADFILTLCNFGRFDLLHRHPTYFVNKAMEILSKEEDIVRSSAALIKLFDALLPTCSSDDKVRLSSFLNRARQNGESREYRNTIEYLIGLYGSQLGNKDLVKESDINYPLTDSKIPRDRWLRDNAITAKLYFYSDEPWFQITASYYQKIGWSKDTAHMRNHHIRGGDTVTYSKRVVGKDGQRIVLRVVLTQSETDSREESINGDEFDIIVHRGHSFHLKETFIPGIHVRAVGKLFFGGSCGSFREMTSSTFLKDYSRNFLLADQSEGEGGTNNETLTRLMEEAARGNTQWGSIISMKNQGKGFILPDNPSFRIGEYLRLNGE